MPARPRPLTGRRAALPAAALTAAALAAGLQVTGTATAHAEPTSELSVGGVPLLTTDDVIDTLVLDRAAAAQRSARAALRDAVAASGTRPGSDDAASAVLPVAADPETLGRTPVSPSSAPRRVAALQTRLSYAGSIVAVTGTYDAATASAVRHFQEKHRLAVTGTADAATVATLQRVTTRGDALDPRCLSAGPVICIDKTQKVLRYVHDGRTVRTLDANFGPERGQSGYGRYSVTREGSFRIYKKAVHHVSTGYGTPMPYAMWFDGAEAVHHSDYFRAAGYANTSQGCATTRDLNALRWVFARTPVGTPAVVYR